MKEVRFGPLFHANKKDNYAIDVSIGYEEQSKLSRVIDLDIDIGADAVDYKCVFFICEMKVENPLTLIYSAIANQESLSGLETEMRKLEGLVKEVVDEMNYLSKREERFSSTNCAYFVVYPSSHYILINTLVSTNQRVQNFAWFTILSLAGLGVWQIFHLRAFFKRKYLID